jgi:hypothetical protein
MKLSTILAGVLLLLGMGMSGAAGAADKLEIIALPGKTEVAARDVGPDIMLAVLAVSQTLRGDGDLSRGLGATRLAPDAKVVTHDAGLKGGAFRYEGYRLSRVTLNVVEPSRHGNPGRRLTGFLQFVNIEGLRAQTAFMVDYLSGPRGIVIHDLQALPFAPADARVVLRALPLKAGQALLEQRPKSIEALLEKTASEAHALPLPAGDWMLFAISPDRVLPGDRLEIHVGTEAGKIDAKAPAATVFDYTSFPVAALPWKSSGRPAIASVFLHTDLHPDKSDGRRLLGTLPLADGKK